MRRTAGTAVAAVMAVSLGAACQPPPFVTADHTVDVSHDAPDANPGDGVCEAVGGGCTLRAAATEGTLAFDADVDPDGSTVVEIAPGVDPLLSLPEASGGGPISLTGTTLRGGGATVDAGGIPTAPAVLVVCDGEVVIEDVSLRGLGSFAGSHVDQDASCDRATGLVVRGLVVGAGGETLGDGIRTRSEVPLLVERSSLTGIGLGTGIVAEDAGPVTVVGTTVTDASSWAIEVDSAAGAPVVVANSTLEDNFRGITVESATTIEMVVVGVSLVDNGWYGIDLSSAGRHNGLTMISSLVAGHDAGLLLGDGASTIMGSTFVDNGIAVDVFDHDLTLVGSTITATSAGDVQLGGGDGATFSIEGSIIDTAGTACWSGGATTFHSGGHNIVSDTSCLLDAESDRTGVDPQLGSLADNGGGTRTRTPLPGSPAIDAVPVGAASYCDGTVADQRGVVRPQGGSCDIGAVEVEVPPGP